MEVKEIMRGGVKPPWLTRFLKQVGRGIHLHSMIGPGEDVLLGVSGGKDSLALAFALAARRRWVRIPSSLAAVRIEWNEYPPADEGREALSRFFADIEIPLSTIQADMFPPGAGPESGKRDFNCYLCSRRRKRILFEEARRRGMKTVALGHHLDDIVETALMNLSFHGEFSSMEPVRHFFSEEYRIIRPLCLVRESTIRTVTARLALPVVSVGCPYRDTNVRVHLKPVVEALSRMNRHARENFLRALG